MNYFVDANLGETITGIEQAEFNRLELFKKAQIPAKIIYMHYNPKIHIFFKKFKIQNDAFSMYDYFQKSIKVSDQAPFDWPSYWQNTCNYSLQYSDDYPDIRVTDESGEIIFYAGFLDNTYTKLNYLNRFDKNHKKIQTDLYDSRGFLSSSNFLAENGLVNSSVYYDPSGKVQIIRQNLTSEKNTYVRNITLTDYNGQQYYFATDEELETFFLNEINQKGDVFYSDRSENFAKSFDMTNSELKIIAVLHNTHVRKGQDVVTGTMKRGVYDYVLTHPQHLAGIICSTEQQKKDLLKRFDNLPPVTVIPVGCAIHHNVKTKKRNHHRIICMARYSPQKQLMHQVRAVEKLVPEFPDIELNLFGSGSREGELKAYISEHNLGKNVLLRGFQKNLNEEYAKGSLFLQTSTEEGFSLSTIEALSYSVPVIGYDINYGPSEMIIDGKNGFLVTADNQDMLYKKMRTYLKNSKLQKKLMKNCRTSIQKFAPEKVQKKWVKLNKSLIS